MIGLFVLKELIDKNMEVFSILLVFSGMNLIIK